MVDVNIQLNPQQANIGGGGGQVLPVGWYQAIIESTTLKGVKDSKNAYIEAKIKCQPSGTYIHRFNIYNDNADAMRIATEELNAFCAVLGIQGQLNSTNQMHNVPFGIHLDHEENEYKGQKRIQNRATGLKYANGQDFVAPKNQGAGGVAQQGGGGAPAGFTPPQGGAPQQPYPQQGGQAAPQQPWGQGQPQAGGPAPQQGYPQPGPGAAPQQGFQPPQQGGFTPPQGGYPQPGPSPQQQQPAPQQGFTPPAQGGFQPPQGGAPQGGFAPPAGGGFQPPQGGPWGGPQG